MTAQEIAARMGAQLSDDERRQHADVVLENDGDLAQLRGQVERAWRALPPAA
jgi:dephospho-CoA kinase